MVFQPSVSPPSHHFQSESTHIIRETRLIQRPLNGEEMLELLAQRIDGWGSKLKANQRPPVLVKHSEVGGGVHRQISNVNGVPSIEKRPSFRRTAGHWSEGMHGTK